MVFIFFQLMKLMAVRRVQMATNGKSDVPLPPAPPPHPGYAPNAALHAIKRHALEFVNPKAAAVSSSNVSTIYLLVFSYSEILRICANDLNRLPTSNALS